MDWAMARGTPNLDLMLRTVHSTLAWRHTSLVMSRIACVSPKVTTYLLFDQIWQHHPISAPTMIFDSPQLQRPTSSLASARFIPTADGEGGTPSKPSQLVEVLFQSSEPRTQKPVLPQDSHLASYLS